MKRAILVATTLLTLLPDAVRGQRTFDIVSVEAYINDHREQRSPLLTRGMLKYSNQLLHEYSREGTDKYKEVNIDLDRYTRASDVTGVMYQSLWTALSIKDAYSSVSDRIGDHETVLEAFHEKILKHGNTKPSDALILIINEKTIWNIANEGKCLCKSMSDPTLYTTGAMACLTSDLLMVLEPVNKSLDSIKQHLNRVYTEIWKYIQICIGYWKSKIYRELTRRGIINGAFGQWCNAGRLGY